MTKILIVDSALKQNAPDAEVETNLIGYLNHVGSLKSPVRKERASLTGAVVARDYCLKLYLESLA
jgi:hypothetical protein